MHAIPIVVGKEKNGVTILEYFRAYPKNSLKGEERILGLDEIVFGWYYYIIWCLVTINEEQIFVNGGNPHIFRKKQIQGYWSYSVYATKITVMINNFLQNLLEVGYTTIDSIYDRYIYGISFLFFCLEPCKRYRDFNEVNNETKIVLNAFQTLSPQKIKKFTHKAILRRIQHCLELLRIPIRICLSFSFYGLLFYLCFIYFVLKYDFFIFSNNF